MIRGVVVRRPSTVGPGVSGAGSDETLIDLWLGIKSKASLHTADAYRRDLRLFRAAVSKPLRAVTVRDLQAFLDGLPQAPRSKARIISTVRSLFRFAHRTGYIALNPATAVDPPRFKKTLAQRILSVAEVERLFCVHPPGDLRRTLFRFLYFSAARLAGAAGLVAQDLKARDGGLGQVTLLEKGDKTRVVLLPAEMWSELLPLSLMLPGAKVFRWSRRRIEELVKVAAVKAGLPKGTSPHWLRHAHATHAIEAGVPLHVVKETLGHASIATTSAYLHANPDTSSALALGKKSLVKEEK